MDDWDDAPAKATDVVGSVEPAAELPEIKLFGKWSCDEVNVSDMSLQVSCTRKPLNCALSSICNNVLAR